MEKYERYLGSSPLEEYNLAGEGKEALPLQAVRMLPTDLLQEIPEEFYIKGQSLFEEVLGKDLHNSCKKQTQLTERSAPASGPAALAPAGSSYGTSFAKKETPLSIALMQNQINNGNSKFGVPTSRRDSLILLKWLEAMLAKMDADEKIKSDPVQMFEITQIIYSFCWKELIRQVSVQCLERGYLLHKLFSSYLSLIENMELMYKQKRKRDRLELVDRIEKFHEFYETRLKEKETSAKTDGEEFFKTKHTL